MKNILTCDTMAAATLLKQPALSIGAQTPLGDPPMFKQLAPQLIQGQTVGAGHFNQLETPEQVNAMMERFLAIHVKA
jgi:hypothetical protein